MEQIYIDTHASRLPEYNIAKIAGSLLNTKWSLESKLRRRESVQLKEHLEKLRLIHINRKVSPETKALLKAIALKRKFTDKKKKKMSLNNNKSIKIIAYFADSNLVYKEFISIAEAVLRRNTFLMIVIVEFLLSTHLKKISLF